MKKFILGMLAAVLVVGGLVSTSEVSASAAPYPGTVRTKVITSGVASKNPGCAGVFVKVTSFGKGSPTGKLEFTFVNKRTGKVYSFSRPYDGAKTYFFCGLSKGKYSISVIYDAPDGSKYKPSAGKTTIKVK